MPETLLLNIILKDKTIHHLPPVAKVTTSKAVKSGLRNTSTSKFGPHGRSLIRFWASLTRVSYLALSCLFTIAVNPARHVSS